MSTETKTNSDLYKLGIVAKAFERDAEAIYAMCTELRKLGAPVKLVYPIERVADAMLDAADAMTETPVLEITGNENNTRPGSVQ